MTRFHRATLAILLGVAHALGAQTPRATFVSVEKDVALEVLDWGGTGVPVVLLAGRGRRHTRSRRSRRRSRRPTMSMELLGADMERRANRRRDISAIVWPTMCLRSSIRCI
jgi:hypothetical protein